ncbi:MAG: M20 family metallopeptidase, partial [Acidobacteria bacterium]|nr:M20 family metallopeptidase [Acidobacteriota bacterium]
MQRFLDYARAQQGALIDMIRTMVECESPSDDAAAVNRQVELMCDLLSNEAKLTRKRGAPYGDHLLIEFNLPGRKKQGQILALGHTDTVYPMGTLKSMPFRIGDGRLWGPGVLDMKGGVALFVFAMRA